jgi:hypothetical protein
MLDRKRKFSGRAGASILRAAPVVLLVSLAPTSSKADWIESLLDERCAPEDVEGINQSVRDAIEASVRRAEASILAPTPVGDLSCLNDLLMQPIDFFSSIGNLLGDLSAGLDGLGSISLDIDVSGMICRMAAEKWAELTRPLSDIEATISSFASAPADAIDRLASGSLSTGGSSGMFPGVSGVMNISSAESIDTYVVPDTSLSQNTSSIPIFSIDDDADLQDYSPSQIALYEEQLRAYNDELAINMAEYMACRTSKNLNGSKITGTAGWYGPTDETWSSPSNLTCKDPLTGLPDYPTLPTLSSSSSERASVSPASVGQDPVDDRAYGQTAPAPSSLPDAGSAAGPSSIWDMLGSPTQTTP